LKSLRHHEMSQASQAASAYHYSLHFFHQDSYKCPEV